jgi:pimeloyl-ACP methyl ester carboxylesterase
MYEYFPGNYWWSAMVNNSLGLGGEMTEIDPVCETLREQARGEIGPGERAAWARAWRALGERVEALAARDAEEGLRASACRKYFRAANYLFVGEVMDPASDGDADKVAHYLAAQRAFRSAVEQAARPVEFVEVPFEGGSLPALFVPAAGDGDVPAPCLVHFDGKDDVKEVTYLRHREGLADRGVSLLIVDHPGSGEALRLRGLYARPDIEVAATAAVDYLESRTDVDPDQIGIIAQSFGGYYAPRSAAFEKRLKVCVVWGAIWDVLEVVTETGYPLVPENWRLLGPLPDSEAVRNRLREFTLEGVIEQVECPLLVFHGENDRQVPLWAAERTVERAVNAATRELRVFTVEEGGAEHCSVDLFSQATDYIHDWVARFFAPVEVPA